MDKWSWSVSGELLLLLFELSDQIVRAGDAIVNVVQLALSLINTLGLSTSISFTKRVDVAGVLADDQVVQVLVIESFATAGHSAGHFVVVQVDAHLTAVTIQQSVILFCFAGIFHNCVLYPWLVIGLIA